MEILERLGVEHAALAAICARHAILRLEIFGSAARDDARPDSDVDVIVSFAPEARPSLYDFVDIQDELAGLFHKPVDVVEEGSVRNPYRARTIERDRQVVYAA